MNELVKIAELQKTLKSLQPLKNEDQQRLDKKFRLEFNYNSNHIEGNTLTYSDTELLLIFDDTKGDHTLREYEEMKGSDISFQLIKEWALDSERPLTEQNIKQLNEILLVRPFWKDAVTEDGQTTRRLITVGDYKKHPNSVRLQNGEMFHYASPTDTPIKMGELIDWYRNEEKKGENPVVLASLLHYKYVVIHPFDDGNGRISRLLMNYVLFKNDLPPIIIKSEDKRNYLSALNRADSGDIESFTKYIAEQVISSLELCIKAAKGESIDEPGDLDKKIKFLKQKLNSSNEEVKITKSKESILSIVNSNIEPLLNLISEKLSEFGSLFKSKDEYLTPINDGSVRFADNLKDSILYLKSQLKSGVYRGIIYKYNLKAFRKGKTFDVDCSMIIEFHENVYELRSLNGNFNYSKLYHENLEKDEVEIIVEELGTSVFNKIEKAINS